MQLGETIATYDVDLALRGESGKFEVTSPTGETYYVTCRARDSLLKSRLIDEMAYAQAFMVRKIAEPISIEQSRRTLAASMQTPANDSGAPFLIEKSAIESGSVENEDLLCEAATAEPTTPEIWNLELLYRDAESRLEQPTASICLVRTGEGMEVDRKNSITSLCPNFNDLDLAIRRLQAQLDDIRVQARKKFYKAHAATASA